jgi:hypothetical protein
MKKLFIITMFLFAYVLSNGQAVRSYDISFNVMSYPTMLLEHQNYNLKIEGLGAVEEYGVTYESIEKLFSKTQKMVYTNGDNYDYTLKIIFGTPSFKNEGVKQNSFGGTTSYYGQAICDIPVYTSLVNKEGLEITEKHLVFNPVTIKGESSGSQVDASKSWNEYLKNNRAKDLTDNVKAAVNAALWDFQSKHDLFTYPKKLEFTTIKVNKRFAEEGWEKNMEELKNIALQMIPGQTLNDYKDSIIPMIKFYDDQYNLFQKNREKGLMVWGALENITNLYLLLADFDKLPKYHELCREFKLMGFFIREQERYAKEYTERYEKFKTGHTVDVECIAMSREKHLKDSLATKPSNVKIYFKNNTIFEGPAFVNIYRPTTVIDNGNIIDLSFGQVLEICEMNTTKVVKRLIAKDITKVEAGDEVFYPVIFGSSDNPRFTYLVFESPKIRVMVFKTDIILLKTGDENAEDFAPPLFGNLNKKMAKYFADCPELVQKINNKEFTIVTPKDIIEVAKKYSELK